MKKETTKKKSHNALLIYMPEETRREFKMLAVSKGSAMSTIALKLITDYMKKES